MTDESVAPTEEVVATPAALDHAAALDVDVAQVRGTGKDGKVTKADVETAVAARPELLDPALADVGSSLEVEATVGFDQATGKYLVSVAIHHSDPTVVAVNGRAVWEGQG